MSLVLTEELEPGILLVTMNRPERLNALSQGLIAELHATFERINTDRSVRVVILTGAGRGFCSGDDLKGVEGEHGAPGTEGMGQIPLILLTQEHLASLHERIHRLRQPVIAAVNGAAVGGGLRHGALVRRPLRGRVGALRLRVRHAGRLVVRHGHQLPAAASGRRVAVLPSSCSLAASSTRSEARAMDLVLDVVPDGDGGRPRAGDCTPDRRQRARWRCG